MMPGADGSMDMKKMIMNFFPMIIIFGLQALKLDYTDPQIIWMFRGIYACGLCSFLGVCALVYTRIQNNSAVANQRVRLIFSFLGHSQSVYSCLSIATYYLYIFSL
jgi:hypothetical protein